MGWNGSLRGAVEVEGDFRPSPPAALTVRAVQGQAEGRGLAEGVRLVSSVLMDGLRRLDRGAPAPAQDGACPHRRYSESGEVALEVDCLGCDSEALPAAPTCRHGLGEVLRLHPDATRLVLARGVRRCYGPLEVEALRVLAAAATPGFALPRARLQVPFSSTWLEPSPPAGATFSHAYAVGDGPLSLEVAVYALPGRPQRAYWARPAEYHLPATEVALLLHARERLVRHPPRELLTGDAAAHGPLVGALVGHMEASPLSRGLARGRMEALAGVLAKHTAGLGIVEDLLSDPNVQDVYVNTPAERSRVQVVWRGEEMETNITLSTSDVESMVSRFRGLSGRAFSQASPVMDLAIPRLNARVAVIGNPLAPGVAYAFRRHRRDPWTLPRLVEAGMLPPMAAGLLSVMVDGQCSVLVTGNRGAGKTSLLGAMLLEVPQRFRVLVIEDTPELPCEVMQRLGWNLQPLRVRASVRGSASEVEAQEALHAALRLGESVLVVGEVRGEEAQVLYEAMRVGSAGNSVLGTIHGSSTSDVYQRVVFDLGIAPSSFAATDAVVVCASVRAGGSLARARRVTQVSEVLPGGAKDGTPGFRDLLGGEAEEGDPVGCLRRSTLLDAIARRFGMDVGAVLEAVDCRSEFHRVLAAGLPRLREAEGYAAAQNAWWVAGERARAGGGGPRAQLEGWQGWLARESARG